MSKPKVFVTRLIPHEGMDMLKKECEVEINPDDRVLTREELKKGVEGKDALLCLLTDTIDAEIMDVNPKLKIIANYAVGYNNIDVKEATKRKIIVTNTPGVLTETTADLAWALLMSIARRITESDKFTREGKFDGWAPMLFLGADVFGKTLGIIGLGRIGCAVAKRALGFNMKIIYTDIKRVSQDIEAELGAEFVSKEELLKKSDFITIHLALTPETKYYIGEEEFNLIKKTSYLINAARGPIINERALVQALKSNQIAGAAIDVYEDEPALSPGLESLDNVVLVPHIGSATIETRTKMATMAAANVVSVLHGEKPANIVNLEVLSVY